VRTDGGAITVTFDVVVMKVVISMTIWLSTVNIVDPSIDVWMTTGFTKMVTSISCHRRGLLEQRLLRENTLKHTWKRVGCYYSGGQVIETETMFEGVAELMQMFGYQYGNGKDISFTDSHDTRGHSSIYAKHVLRASQPSCKGESWP